MSEILYAIGAGPGDPELITAKGLRLLRQADTVFVPATRAGQSYSLSIVEQYLDRKRQQVVELLCPPYRDRRAVEERWRALAGVVAEHLTQGCSGAFVCEGDPSLYSTFLHLRRGLLTAHPNIEIAVIPGVTSISASAALAGFSLASWDERLLIAPAVHEPAPLEALLAAAENVAILKPGRALPALMDAVQARSSEVRAALVRRAGRPEQQVLHEPAAMRLAGDDYFTTLLISRRRAGGDRDG